MLAQKSAVKRALSAEGGLSIVVKRIAQNERDQLHADRDQLHQLHQKLKDMEMAGAVLTERRIFVIFWGLHAVRFTAGRSGRRAIPAFVIDTSLFDTAVVWRRCFVRRGNADGYVIS